MTIYWCACVRMCVMCVRVYVFVYYMIFQASANALSALQPHGCNAAIAGGLKRNWHFPLRSVLTKAQ